MKTLIISEAASFFAVSIPTLRRWDLGRLPAPPDFRTTGGHRRYLLVVIKK